jgi:hypothetical protein
MPLRITKIDKIEEDNAYKYRVVCSEHVDELFYEIVKVHYCSDEMDAYNYAQVWENFQ